MGTVVGHAKGIHIVVGTLPRIEELQLHILVLILIHGQIVAGIVSGNSSRPALHFIEDLIHHIALHNTLLLL